MYSTIVVITSRVFVHCRLPVMWEALGRELCSITTLDVNLPPSILTIQSEVLLWITCYPREVILLGSHQILRYWHCQSHTRHRLLLLIWVWVIIHFVNVFPQQICRWYPPRVVLFQQLVMLIQVRIEALRCHFSQLRSSRIYPSILDVLSKSVLAIIQHVG